MAAPDHTAVRVALWRALHTLVDSPPHVIEDDIGLRLAAPDEGWRIRPDMDPQFTMRARASIVGRARFIEDLLIEQQVAQYVILGAGLDTFAERRPEIASHMHVFEVDKPGTQEWKRQRLIEVGFGIPEWLHLVPVEFESQSWWEELMRAGFDTRRVALFSSTGVSMYLTREAIAKMLRQIATAARGSTLVMTFLVPKELVEPEERPLLEISEKGARAAGTPFLSFFAPEEMLAFARDAGFREVRHVSGAELARRYFAGRTDGLRPGTGEAILVATA